jgi:outer membrane lipoprotein-sorting protein
LCDGDGRYIRRDRFGRPPFLRLDRDRHTVTGELLPMTARTTARPFLRALCLAALLAVPTAGAVAQAEAPTDQTLSDVNAYFNAIKTMKGRFVQFGPSGEKVDGQFAIARPGKVRFHYNDPSTIDIIADGTSVAVRDRRRATQDIWPLKRTPLRFLLQDDLDLTTDANVTDVDITPDLVKVTIEENTAFGQGRLTMMFDGTSHELRQWNVVDADGQETSVSIYDVRTGEAVDAGLFEIDYTRILERGRN